MRIGSLFSGCGMLDHGVAGVLGGTVVWHSEIDRAAAAVLAHHNPGVPNLGDISAVDWARVEPVDALVGGFPCQDVSAAGRRAGLKDGTRSGLWARYADAIAALRPRIVVIENVRGLLNGLAHRTEDNERADSELEPEQADVGDEPAGPVLRAGGAVAGDLADLGYDAAWITLPAAAVGAPHERQRVFIVAWDADADGDGRDGRRAQALEGDAPVRPGPGLGDDGRRDPAAADAEHGGLWAADGRGPQGARPRQLRGGHPEPAAGQVDSPLLPSPRASAGRYGLAPDPDELRALLPTPTAFNAADNMSREQWDAFVERERAKGYNGDGHGRALAMEARDMLPTPLTSDTGGPVTEGDNRRAAGSPQLCDVAATELLPTPTTWQQGGPSADERTERDGGNSPDLPGAAQVLGRLQGDDLLPGLTTAANQVWPAAGSQARAKAAELIDPPDPLLPTPTSDPATRKSDAQGGQLLLGSVGDLLPTPGAANAVEGQRSAETLEDGAHQANLTDLPRLLPTPTGGDGGSTSRGGDRIDEPLLGGIANLLPTPTECPTGRKSDQWGGEPGLAGLATGGLLPTPVGMDSQASRRTTYAGAKDGAGDTLTDALWKLEGFDDNQPPPARLPTPQANIGNQGGRGQPPDKRRAGGHSVSLADFAADPDLEMLRTPQSRDWKGGGANQPDLNDGVEEMVSSLLPTPASTDRFGPNRPDTRDGGDALRTVACWEMDPLLRSPSLSDVKTPGEAGERAAAGHQVNLADQVAGDPTGRNWGRYAPAIRRWEAVVGTAPDPTEPNSNGNPRLNPAFAEWMMGWPAGWVTAVPGVKRNEQLKIIGNGVCPQQAAAALRLLLPLVPEEALMRERDDDWLRDLSWPEPAEEPALPPDEVIDAVRRQVDEQPPPPAEPAPEPAPSGREKWVLAGVGTPSGLDPTVDGQRCYTYRRTDSGRLEVRVIPVAQFWPAEQMSLL